MLRGKDVHEVEQMKQMGLSVSAISEMTGYDRKTVRKYLLEPEAVPAYSRRAGQPSKLDPHKPYLQDRLTAGVWNAQVLLREIRQRGYGGGYTILKDWLLPQRAAASVAAVRRFETPPGKQAQVDWGHLGYLDIDGRSHQVWGFTITLGYSRRLWAQAALDQKLGTLLRMHEAAFQEWGAVPEEILYDRMKTVWLGSDERGEVVWHPVFLDFARYWGFKPQLCRPYRAQTKGKIESGVKYVRRNFVCSLLGREPACLMDFNSGLRQWVDTVANRRAWDHLRASARALGRRSVRDAATERSPALSVQRRRVAEGSAGRLRELASQPVLRAVAVCRKGSLGSRKCRPGGSALWRRADCRPSAGCSQTPSDHRARASR